MDDLVITDINAVMRVADPAADQVVTNLEFHTFFLVAYCNVSLCRPRSHCRTPRQTCHLSASTLQRGDQLHIHT
jgi:hypothetical protein